MTTFWLSFAPERGPGRVILVDAETTAEAHRVAHVLGAYKSGDETLIFEIPEGCDEHALPRNEVLSLDDVRQVRGVTLREIDEEFGPELANRFLDYRVERDETFPPPAEDDGETE